MAGTALAKRRAMSRPWLALLLCGTAACGADDHATAADHAAPHLGDALDDDASKIVLNKIVLNALTSNALLTNRSANAWMISHALKSATFASPSAPANFRDQLHDPNAQEFLKYLVGCALPPPAPGTHSLTWTDRFNGRVHTFDGELGLASEWAAGAPSSDALERVSACLLARNNAFGVSVMLSLHDNHEDGALQGWSPIVPGSKADRTTGDDVTRACPYPQAGLARDCGWTVHQIGICLPGSTVTVAAGVDPACTGRVIGDSTGNPMLRVCPGTSGCNGVRALAANNDACGSPAPGVRFTCPASATFTVMSAPYVSTQGYFVNVKALGYVHYAAPEQEIFRWQEGAFFGNLFAGLRADVPDRFVTATGALVGAQRPPLAGSLFTQMFACSSPSWSSGPAYMAGRVCASGAGYDCAARHVGTCTTVCEETDGWRFPGDGDFGKCHDGRREAAWMTPITTWLNQPCDTVPGPLCAKTPATTPLPKPW